MSEQDSVLEYNEELVKQVAEAQNAGQFDNKRAFLVAAIVLLVGIIAMVRADPWSESNGASKETPSQLAK